MNKSKQVVAVALLFTLLSAPDSFAFARRSLTPHDTLDPLRFQSGDFLWKKYDGAWLPYGALDLVQKFIYVGHVAIIDLDHDGLVWVIEALPEVGVQRIHFEEWLLKNIGNIFWQGRLRGYSSEERAHVAEAAQKYIGKPYSYFNFNLVDDSSFYCSKLAWLAIYNALGVAIDDEPNPNRTLWFSPKQMLHLLAIERVVDSGAY